ncbi:hypothetical protein T05_11263 [Trichinella murrelli]|uniref:Uncharacterized protein n=1 Tax=Trichinella murrelli TaxID=144512 RepID=A0A0V0T3I2_9BILA|nr:hypothetical protein T05_8529 [Trichinella murrelli]KRX33827.1 hypothetical protein T05_6137 [Trichinella murrelli]KRX34168.1 hypothetical protein T05_15735 [Trichinella murrelli]KRX34988.1 hypothetical protein T05_11263 [Trichinella murrelli]
MQQILFDLEWSTFGYHSNTFATGMFSQPNKKKNNNSCEQEQTKDWKVTFFLRTRNIFRERYR